MKLFYNLLFICLSQLAFSQPTISNQSFPTVGDTLKYSIDTQPTISISPPGQNMNWDFTSLTSTLDLDEIYLDASEGMASDSFPNADMVVIIGENNERYFSVDNNCIEEIAFVNSELVGNLFNISGKYLDPPKIRRAPINFEDSFSDEIRFGIAFDSEEIPDTLLDMLPFTPDSIRVSINSTVNDTIDSWGTLDLPGGSYEALRMKSVSTVEFILELKLFIWIPINLSDIDGIDSLLNLAPQLSYSFISDSHKEILANISMGTDDQIISTQYKRNEITSAANEIELNKTLSIYPNPAMDRVNIQFDGPENISRIYIYNSHGKGLSQVNLRGKKYVDLNISTFSPGLYFIKVVDQAGNFIGASRFLKF